MSEVNREVKADSTNRVKKNGWANGKFRWQNGYALLSYSQSHLDRADRYIERQAYHHRSMNYEDEYTRILDLYKGTSNNLFWVTCVEISFPYEARGRKILKLSI